MSLSWVPIRRGAIYCSPACGHRCTFTEYKKAHIEATECLALMKTRGWDIRVWENLGWHCGLENAKGHLSIHQATFHGKRQYHALLSHNTPGAGNPQWTPSAWRDDPNDAVATTMAMARKDIGAKDKFLTKVERGLVG